ncbi:MAG: aldo/keto reductase [Acidobacteria bacterium]|uniref:Aldo/keto reductase n=1 Tax=Candidatus Polarisedimenticola svalbardensis TaxID=2886004 RepID=A0A8J6XVQ8_9BACT|nr:aldo/keto reductase [Candidatus Polarisedimenticola svalbardensis]
MEYRRLGSSGLKVSALSFGSWVTFHFQMGVDPALKSMEIAYDGGINFFDNAEVYAAGESEIIMGQALKKAGWRRDSYCVSSKVYWGGDLPTQRGLSRKHIHDACHAALNRLQVDYLDLFFCHRPDLDTPVEETVRAMHDLVQQGKILYWGTSEWPADQIMQAYGIARQQNMTPPTMEQPQYNMLHRDRFEGEYRRLYEEIGLGTTIWSPLASGVLTGKYTDGVPEGSRLTLPDYGWLKDRILSDEGKAQIAKAEELKSVADDLGTNRALLAIAWCLKNPNVSTVILGASKPEQVTENLKAMDLLPKLTDEVMDRIETILGNKPEPPIRW